MQYSNDLRRKLVEAWNVGPETQPELADLFGVSLGWIEKVLRRWRETGDTAALVFRHGPRSRLQPAHLEKLIQKHSDATLGELGRRLRVSAPTVGRWLRQLGLPRKKRRCMPANATPLVCSGCVRVGGRSGVIWTRTN
ncbi:MAG: transposase [Acidobacteriaceae bacterium]|nr:transposase [Acidobacteriaceae bacterium]